MIYIACEWWQTRDIPLLKHVLGPEYVDNCGYVS